jgi:hypothetical protein
MGNMLIEGESKKNEEGGTLRKKNMASYVL